MQITQTLTLQACNVVYVSETPAEFFLFIVPSTLKNKAVFPSKLLLSVYQITRLRMQ